MACTSPAPTSVLGTSGRPLAVVSSRRTEAAIGSSYADCSSASTPDTSAVAYDVAGSVSRHDSPPSE